VTSGGSEVEAGGGAGYRRVEELRGQIGGEVQSEYGSLAGGVTGPGITDVVCGEQGKGEILANVGEDIESSLPPIPVGQGGEVAHRLQECECGGEPGGGEDPVHGWFGVSV
jgi:hypothetical protein